MIESLLAKMVIGVVAGGIFGATAYGVYKYITKDSAKEEIKEKLKTEEDENIIHKAFKAKVKEKDGRSVSFDILDEMDEEMCNVDIFGDEISNDIDIGTEIIL